MKNYIIILAVLCALPAMLNAQNNWYIKGTVTDSATQESLPFALVQATCNNTGANTDLDGNYSFSIAGHDSCAIVFSCIGYRPDTVMVRRGSNDVIELNVALSFNSQELSVVSVVASKYEIVSMENVAGVQIVGGKQRKNKKYKQYQQPEAFNTEEYNHIEENGFKKAEDTPLSTFSIDVDKASYSNVRRHLLNGNLPPEDAVRVEELINYFPYDYATPQDETPFNAAMQLGPCPWNPDHQLLRIGLKGQEVDKTEMPPNNLVFLVDVSGSMLSYDKLPLLKNSLQLLVQQMRPEDKVSLVVYAGNAGVVLEPTSGKHKDKILDALEELEAGGSTAGGAGIRLAYDQAEQHFMKNGNNRVILATDGDFNVGTSSEGELVKLIENKRETGVYLTVLGFGQGNYKDNKMEGLADHGNGNYFYIDNLMEGQKVLLEEMGGTLLTIAKDVKIQVEFNPALVSEYRLVGYENRLLDDEDFNDDTKDAGEIGAGHTVTALYEIVPAGASTEKSNDSKVDPLRYQDKTLNDQANNSGEWLLLKLRYKLPKERRSTKIEIPLTGSALSVEEVDEDFLFAAAVASFGMLLRNSEYKGTASYQLIEEWALKGKGADNGGYRSEFIKMVNLANSLSGGTSKR